jgi:hypothetical protein
MDCRFLGGQVLCDGDDDRCARGCFTHSDCCAQPKRLVANWKQYSCADLGLDDPRCLQ